MKTRLFLITLTVIVSSQLFLATSYAEEQKQFQVITKMNFPESIPVGETIDFTIDVTYKGPFSWVKNLEPKFDVIPNRANYDIDIQYDDSISEYTIWKGHIHTLHGTIHVSDDTSFEAIFLSISFEGIVRFDDAVVSIDPDSTVSLNIGESALIVDSPIPEPKQDVPAYENCGPGTTYQDGICVVNKIDNSTKSSSDKWEGYPFTQDIESPLKQFNSGVLADEIQCRDNLVFIQKYDGSPACVKESTVTKLSERGWINKNKDDVLSNPSNQKTESESIYKYKFEEQQFGEYNRVVFSHSVDNGKTFSKPVDMGMTNTNSYEPKMIVLNDNVLLVWRGETSSRASLAIATSTDHGKTFEKKYLMYGARPDLVYHNDILYLAWVNLDNHQVLYSTSKNLEMNFSEPIIVFMPTERFSPYTLAPTPIFSAEGQNIIINWKHSGKNYHHVVGVDLQIPKLPQNDLQCWTFWNATVTPDLDYNQLEKNIRNKIELLPQMYSVPEREINVEKIEENKVQIIIQGCWGMSNATQPDIKNIIGEIEGTGDINVWKPEPIHNEDGTTSDNPNPYTLYDFSGFKRLYKVGESISFTETVHGFGNPCVSPHYEILDGNTLEPVWEYKIVYPCPFIKDPQQFKIKNIVPNEKVESPAFNQTGPYIFRSYHTYDDGYSVKTFSVVNDSFVQTTIDPCNVIYDLDANDVRKKTAPPISISEYGRDATLLEPFVFETSIGKLTVPSYVPSCYELQSDKIENDRRTLVYYPKDMPYDDSVTGTKIIKEGILFLISSTSETPEEWSDSISKSINESPDIHSLTTLKGHEVLLIHGIPSKDMSSNVKMVIDDKKIQIISTKLDTSYLIDVLESMFEE